jgi:HlyD family secretion protein/epimerase transport system membrane fusion protein
MPTSDVLVQVDTRPDALRFFAVAGLFLGLFFFWGMSAELDSGAIVVGEVIPAGRVRPVQHADGGIIREIFIHEGDRVGDGSPLIRLDDTEAKTALKLTEQEISGLARRLTDAQREVSHWQAREFSLRRIMANADEESRLNQKLYESNFISKSRLLQIESQNAQSSVSFSENAAEFARARQKVSEVESAIAAAKERGIVARERLVRTVVLSPQEGTVNNLRVTTLGGVVAPGGYILDVVPATEQLVIEARVSPDDIDVVSPGLDARVRLTAYKSRSHISLHGVVTQVSGSTFRDDQSQGRSFFKVRVEISPDELKKIDRGVLAPGMLAQVEIVAGRRVALRYLFDPVLDSIRRAFRED